MISKDIIQTEFFKVTVKNVHAEISDMILKFMEIYLHLFKSKPISYKVQSIYIFLLLVYDQHKKHANNSTKLYLLVTNKTVFTI